MLLDFENENPTNTYIYCFNSKSDFDCLVSMLDKDGYSYSAIDDSLLICFETTKNNAMYYNSHLKKKGYAFKCFAKVFNSYAKKSDSGEY